MAALAGVGAGEFSQAILNPQILGYCFHYMLEHVLIGHI